MLSCEHCLIILEVKVSQGSRLSSVTTAFHAYQILQVSNTPTIVEDNTGTNSMMPLCGSFQDTRKAIQVD